MILKRKLEWEFVEGRRAVKGLSAPDMAKRLLAFERLSCPEGFSLGAPHFKTGGFSFYHLDGVGEATASGSFDGSEAMLFYQAASKEDGAEAFSPFDFMPMDVCYKVSYNDDRTEASISAELEVVSFAPAVIFAALSVDGLELLPSARVPLSKGLTTASLRPVRLLRPKALWRSGADEPAEYEMDLDLGVGGGKIVRDVRRLSVWG